MNASRYAGPCNLDKRSTLDAPWIRSANDWGPIRGPEVGASFQLFRPARRGTSGARRPVARAARSRNARTAARRRPSQPMTGLGCRSYASELLSAWVAGGSQGSAPVRPICLLIRGGCNQQWFQSRRCEGGSSRRAFSHRIPKSSHLTDASSSAAQASTRPLAQVKPAQVCAG